MTECVPDPEMDGRRPWHQIAMRQDSTQCNPHLASAKIVRRLTRATGCLRCVTKVDRSIFSLTGHVTFLTALVCRTSYRRQLRSALAYA